MTLDPQAKADAQPAASPNSTGHAGHGGNRRALLAAAGRASDDLLDASANLNPLGPPAWLDAACTEGRRLADRYPDPEYLELRQIAAKYLGLDAGTIVFGNGADELLFALARRLAARLAIQQAASTQPPTPAPTPRHFVLEPGYASYREASQAAGYTVESTNWTNLQECLNQAPNDSAVWLGTPNNPDGWLPPEYPASIARLATRFPQHWFILDEAFIDFVEPQLAGSALPLCGHLPNLIVVRSMTKFWCVPGLRLGYAVWYGDADGLRLQLPNWPLNCMAEAFARRAFADPTANQGRQAETVALLGRERARLSQAIAALPQLKFLPGMANFYLLRDDSGRKPDLANSLLAHSVAVRRCDNFHGLETSANAAWVRIAIRTPTENDRILAALTAYVSGHTDQAASSTSLTGETSLTGAASLSGGASGSSRATGTGQQRAKALMIQGCSSNAGKSLITAAFCRILRNRGWDVAPYKAQNMSLNSAVTADGLELGRAQAVQAAACGLPPDVRMNPVLLKPESDRGSQVVLLGKAWARCQAAEYYELHHTMRDTARAAYDSLAAEHRLIILEGAGSPAEINLKPRDFVNMGAALHAAARVLLVGDIDRGGVFASFIGTASTFAPEELRLFAGFLVNKFRGDPLLLGNAFAMTADRTGFPVLGCVPMIANLNIPDEDEPLIKASRDPAAPIKLAVPMLRRVSNFTDLDAFAAEPDVAVFPVDTPDKLARLQADAIIIPGSKSTVADLQWLRDSGLAAAIRDFAARGGAVVGICGGYQMLGRTIIDREGRESDCHECAGLDLLPLVTEFHPDKTLVPCRASWLEGDLPLHGYEIHHGQTRPLADSQATAAAVPAGRRGPAVRRDDGTILGYRRGTCWGSYLHGIFDADEFRRAFLNGLRARQGLEPLPVHRNPGLDLELDRLAESVEANVDMAAILRLIE